MTCFPRELFSGKLSLHALHSEEARQKESKREDTELEKTTQAKMVLKRGVFSHFKIDLPWMTLCMPQKTDVAVLRFCTALWHHRRRILHFLMPCYHYVFEALSTLLAPQLPHGQLIEYAFFELTAICHYCFLYSHFKNVV